MVDKWQNFPAKFSDEILVEIRKWISSEDRILDPFVGAGRIHEISPHTVGLDIEPEAAAWHPRSIVGNALCQPFADDTFDVIATSVTYANRMADSHNAQERCKACDGNGGFKVDSMILYGIPGGEDWGEICEKCHGKGRREYKRITYTHTLGHKLHQDNSGGMQWGKKYKDFHEFGAWPECIRVLKPGGRLILNCSNHYRGGELQLVTEWHIEVLEGLGLKQIINIPIETKRMGFGANRELRDDHESVVVFELQ